MDGARRIPISSDSYFLGWLEPSDTLFVEERRKKGERERERENGRCLCDKRIIACKQNDVLGGWGERRIILRSTMSSDYSYFVPLVLIRGDTPVQAAIMSAI